MGACDPAKSIISGARVPSYSTDSNCNKAPNRDTTHTSLPVHPAGRNTRTSPPSSPLTASIKYRAGIPGRAGKGNRTKEKSDVAKTKTKTKTHEDRHESHRLRAERRAPSRSEKVGTTVAAAVTNESRLSLAATLFGLSRATRPCSGGV